MLSLFLLLLVRPLSARFSFSVTNYAPGLPAVPSQCSNLTLELSSGGVPPYEITLLPLGHVVPETRAIVDVQSSSTTWVHELQFPENSTFVIVLSDTTGFGTGGTSDVYTVSPGPTSCLSTGPPPQLAWTFSVDPSTPTQCEEFTFLWENSAQPPVIISAVVPGGYSFNIPVSPAGENASTQGWLVDMPEGAEVAFIVGDRTGRAAGGSSDLMRVSGSGNATCVGRTSGVTTSGPAAGMVTSTAGGSSMSAVSGIASTTDTGSITSTASSTGSASTASPSPTASNNSNGARDTKAFFHTCVIFGGIVGFLVLLL